MKITHNLTIDLQRRGNLQKIDVVQGDTYTRLVNISLYNNGVLWDVPTDSGILVRYHKPDGTSGIYEELPDGSPAGVIEENNVLVTLAPQMLTAPGKVPTQVSIVVDDQVLSTFSFAVDVEEDPSKGAVGSENYHSWKSSFIPQTSGAFVGQYLEITAVDSNGRVAGIKGVVNPAIQAELMASDAKRAATESGYLANEASETAKSAYAYAKLASENATNANELATSVSGKADEALKTSNDANNLSARNADDIAYLVASKLPQVTGAKVGQYIKITEVDELGRVVAFEAVNAPTSGSISGDLEMHGDSINNVGSLSFIGPSNTSVDGFWIQSGAAVSNEDGSKMAVAEFYSSDTDDSVVIRNVAPGVEDNDAVNVAQLSEKISQPTGEIKVGQTIVVKELNETGIPVSWETKDFPSGGNADQSGLTAEQISALDGMFKICAYTADATDAYKAFQTAFGIGGSGGGEVEPDVPVVPDEPDVPETGVSNEATWTDGVAYDINWTDGIYISLDGEEKTYSGWKATQYLYCDGAAKLTISNTAGSSGEYSSFYDVNKVYISSFSGGAISTNDHIIPENAVYFRVSCTTDNVSNIIPHAHV